MVATKVFMPMTPGRERRAGCRASTSSPRSTRRSQRLGMDYVDLYQIHRWDPRTPIEETMQALHDVVRAGKARYIGASSMFAWQFAKAQHTADAAAGRGSSRCRTTTTSIYREEEREMIPQCIDQGVGGHPVEPARPRRARRQPDAGRASGCTTRAGTDEFGDYAVQQADRLRRRRARGRARGQRGVPQAQVALAWLLHGRRDSADRGRDKVGHLTDALAGREARLSERRCRVWRSRTSPPGARATALSPVPFTGAGGRRLSTGGWRRR